MNKPWTAVVPGGLIVLAALICAGRLHTFRQPLSLDPAMYAVIGHELLAGRALYSDVWDIKPPAIYATYALAEKAAGYGPWAIYLLSGLAAVLTLLGVFAATKILANSSAAGLWAAAFWAAVCGDVRLEAALPNAEAFMNACLVWAFYFFLKRRDARSRVPWTLGAGLLLAAASLYKQVAVPIAFFWLIVHVFVPSDESPARAGRIRDALKIAGAAAGVWAGVALYFAATGRGGDFYKTVIVTDLGYAGFQGSLASYLRTSLDPAALRTLLPPGALYGLAPLMGLTVLGAASRRLSRLPRAGWLWIAYAAGVQLAIALPGRFYSHYYQLWLPPLAIGAAWAIERLKSKRSGLGRWASALGAAAFAALLCVEIPLLRLSADDGSRLLWNEKFITIKKMGEDLALLLRPEETFFQWGHGVGLYYYSRRRPPTGVMDISHLFTGPLRPELERRVLAELERRPPELFITFREVMPAAMNHPVFQWALRRYDPFPGVPRHGPFILYARRGGPLEARVKRSLRG